MIRFGANKQNQRQIALMAKEGKKAPAIAKILGIRVSTVENFMPKKKFVKPVAKTVAPPKKED